MVELVNKMYAEWTSEFQHVRLSNYALIYGSDVETRIRRLLTVTSFLGKKRFVHACGQIMASPYYRSQHAEPKSQAGVLLNAL